MLWWCGDPASSVLDVAGAACHSLRPWRGHGSCCSLLLLSRCPARGLGAAPSGPRPARDGRLAFARGWSSRFGGARACCRALLASAWWCGGYCSLAPAPRLQPSSSSLLRAPRVACVRGKNRGENPAWFLRAGGGGATCVIYLLGGVAEASSSGAGWGRKSYSCASTNIVGVCGCQFPS
jgi:hypothetical protein